MNQENSLGNKNKLSGNIFKVKAAGYKGRQSDVLKHKMNGKTARTLKYETYNYEGKQKGNRGN